jgi:hypothetical protein
MKRGVFFAIGIIVLLVIALLIFSKGAASTQTEIFLPAVPRDPMPGDPIQVTSIEAIGVDRVTITLDQVNISHVYPVMIYAWETWDIFSERDRVEINDVSHILEWERAGFSNADVQALSRTDYRNVYVYIYLATQRSTTVRKYIKE